MNKALLVVYSVFLSSIFQHVALGFAICATSLRTHLTIEDVSVDNFTESLVTSDSTALFSPFKALDFFLSIQADLQKRKRGNIEIVSRGSSNIPKHQPIDVWVYTSTEKDTTIITLVSKGQSVSVSQLEAVLKASSVQLVHGDETISFCGFPPGCVPPLGHLSDKEVQIVVDQQLVEHCQSNNLPLLGSGGCPYWQCLVDADLMLSLPNVKVALITSPYEKDESETATSRDIPLPWTTTDGQPDNEPETPRPLLEMDPPPMNVAGLVARQRDLSNPLTPTLVTIKGQIGKVDRKGKRNAVCELLPCHEHLDRDHVDPPSEPLPWSFTNGEPLALRLLAGKSILQKLGTTQGEAAIDHLREGVVIQAKAMTNVGNRDALEAWVRDRTMELLLIDYQIFTEEGEVDDGSILPSGRHKHKPQSSVPVPILPHLTLQDIFKNSVTIEIVDNLESIESFARDYETLQFYLDEGGAASMVGVDCEWQPNQLADPDGVRPVLLLQLSFHALEKVYLFDLQSLFRPLEPNDQDMNVIETRVSDALSKLWTSERVFKVGYQLGSDLRRIAASYPHIACFQEVHSVIEVDNLVKRVLHITKQKKSRSITMSLARMTSHYMGKTVDKTFQVSDWMARPLTDEQKIYAALDAAVAPSLVEKALSSVNASINPNVPRIERWNGDEGLANVVNSMRFSFLETEDVKSAKKLQAKQMVGDHWVVTQSWISGQDAPSPIS